ncbi:hypothetical protein GpartN1_g5936.t1 [Galdieria partita]|uniref:Uncharacterized protein n=1 Tax=Galdieria partita TaxID=83374 RepID=A0A9C7Q1G5_9RHOD|nr:hypothetical protein GpartN1_g5936.t1 [Galdieria partita]
MVSPHTSRNFLREIISVSPRTELATTRSRHNYSRVRYSKNKNVHKEKLLGNSWLLVKNMYNKKLTWFVIILLVTCFNALLEKLYAVPSNGIPEESIFQITTSQVDKEIPYESWWRDDTDYEQLQQQLSNHPGPSLSHLETSTQVQNLNEKSFKASPTPSFSQKPKTTAIKKETTKNANEMKAPKNPSASSKKKVEQAKQSMRVSSTPDEIIDEPMYFSLNQTKIMLMLSKFIKQYRIESVVHGRCKTMQETMDMIKVVERYPNVRFLGMHPDSQTIDKYRKKLGESLRRKFVVKDVMDEIPFGFHLMWNLEGIHDQPYETVLRYFVQLKRKKYKYVALIHVLYSNNDKVIREKGTYIPINVRAKPFSLPMPLRMVKEVGKDRNGHLLQLLLYDISQLPDMENDEYLREFLSWIG